MTDQAPAWLDRTPGNVAAADQIKAEAIDVLRSSDFSVLISRVPDGRKLIAVGEGVTGELREFCAQAAADTFTWAVEATEMTPIELWALICFRIREDADARANGASS